MLVSNECCMFARSDHLRMRRDLQQSRDRASLEMKISALLFSGLLICSAHTYTGTAPRGPDCGAPGWSVPEPPSGAKLLQVNTIIRSIFIIYGVMQTPHTVYYTMRMQTWRPHAVDGTGLLAEGHCSVEMLPEQRPDSHVFRHAVRPHHSQNLQERSAA